MSTDAPAPGWYTDPEDPANRRYWDGQHWLVPAADPEPAAERPPLDQPNGNTPIADDVALAPGWYAMPDDPTISRYWSGEALGLGHRPSQGEPQLPRALAEADAASHNRRFLITSYIFGALIPIYGWGVAIYIGVSEKYAAIRRHAFGIAAVALIAAAIYAVVIVSVNKSHQDRNVASDLQSLLASHGVSASNISCAHESGNEYACVATINGQQQSAAVTDDGQSIYEFGINASGG